MAVAPPTRRVGELLRDWRRRKRMSQLDLALDAGVSARHLSFVETGRSNASRELILALTECLEVPLRERNALLLAAGYAPVYGETALGDDAMGPVREALEKILTGHEPYPAVILDRQWELITANRAALSILTLGVAPELLAPPVNALRLTLHPDGLAPRIDNLSEWSAHLLVRLRREALLSGDPALTALHEELCSYPGVAEPATIAVDPPGMLFVPLLLRLPDGTQVRFFSTLATFGTALDVTLSEMLIESFFPADEATEETLRKRPSLPEG
jgi:transcriptional regulator with XRE-family HTH domain